MNQITLVALVIFAITYVLMMIFQKIRPHIVAVSALIFVGLGIISAVKPDLFGADFFTTASGTYSYNITQAIAEIDWNVIMMIAGTMGTVYLFIESKMPQLLSDVLISKMPNMKWVIVVISLFAGIVSAFVDNVATVLMIAPVALAFCKKLNASPVPAIICIAISSNLQGAATLVGDTTSILLGKAANLDFSDFFVDNGKPGMFWVVEAGAVVSAFIILFMFRKETNPISFNSRTKVEDYVPTYLLVGTVVALIAVSFIPYKDGAAAGQFYKPDITNGLICVLFFLIGVVRELVFKKNKETVKNAFKDIDYYTIILLTCLFIVIGGIKAAGVIDVIGSSIAKLGSGSVFIVYTIIVWMSVILSAFIDNIPYTATMLSIIPVIAADLGMADPKLLYYGLLCGATLGGNLTPIGASANITGIGILRKEGYEVKSTTFMKYSVPFTLSAVTCGYVLLWIIWN